MYTKFGVGQCLMELCWVVNISEILKHPELSLTDTRHLPPVSLGILVKIARVSIITNLGNYGRLQLLVVDLLPVNIFEPSKIETELN